MLDKIFNVFSRREKTIVDSQAISLPIEFRNRVVMLLRDELQDSFVDCLSILRNKLAYLHGKFQLNDSRHHSEVHEDALHFMCTCKDEYFLDVIELIFNSDISGVSWPDNTMIPAINQFFQIDDLPFHLTPYVTEELEMSFYGTSTTETRIAEYPRVIRKDKEVIYKFALEPALQILRGKEFKSANSEFLNALEDQRKGDFRDCLTKCGSAFESTMKVLCKKNSISYKETDTATSLLKSLLQNSQLDSYWEQPLILIATLRNRLSSSHGAGSQSKNVPPHVAAYVVNATASAIVFLESEFS
ncbi:abortive infection family protein [Nitrosomonas ureae]|uniref:Abortive infection Abi-like protein n=1 Tax=Nitrosomonas ureae TaxID=44577 RepID=A0A2T5IVD5_9PROT|nr:abortive infection family protein [Nitrosomonas ureae]PTQ87813.1 abortive infection Abi-like protein [Nitrosomonas ureae]